MRRRSKRAILGFLFLASLIILLLFSIANYFKGKEEKRLFQEQQAAIVQPPPNVHTVERATRNQVRRYSAEVLPWADTEVSAEVSGVILSAEVEAGARVEKGDVLVQLDPRLAELEVEQVRARHRENERLLQEAETLAARSVTTRSDLEAARARAAASQAELDTAVERLARHSIRAPFAGVINRRLVEPGSSVSINQPVAELVDMSRLRVVFHVSDMEIGDVRPGTSVELVIPALPGRTFQPEIQFLAVAADVDTRLYRVEAVLEDAEGIPARVQGRVQFAANAFRDMPFIPVSAVTISGRQAYVQKVIKTGTDFETERTPVEIGPEVDGAYPVLSGLNAGDAVLIR